MAKTRVQKEKEVSAVADNLKKSKIVVMLSFAGLTVKDEKDLRNKMREAGGAYIVIKKTLLERILKDAGLTSPQIAETKGSIAVGFGFEDEVTAAKILHTFGKEKKTIKLISGIYNNEVVDAATVTQLATLPSKEQLLTQLVFVMGSPMRNLVSVLSGPSRNLVTVLKAIQEKK